jgi:hypothetical protein
MKDQKYIIHFTDSLKALQGILVDSGFRLKFCQEEFSFGKKTVSSAVHAMVCFSSYSPSTLKTAKITYGSYGISLTEGWALNKGIHEVLYLEKNSTPAKALASLLRARQGKNGDFPDHLRLPVMQIRCFVKNAKGKNKKAGSKEFDFRSEREWRFVPSHDQVGGSRISQNQSYYDKHYKKLNDDMWLHKVSFTLKDVAQIYVPHAAEIDLLVKHTGLNRELFSISPWQTHTLPSPANKK